MTNGWPRTQNLVVCTIRPFSSYPPACVPEIKIFGVFCLLLFTLLYPPFNASAFSCTCSSTFASSPCFCFRYCGPVVFTRAPLTLAESTESAVEGVVRERATCDASDQPEELVESRARSDEVGCEMKCEWGTSFAIGDAFRMLSFKGS